jgi:hypothetical protein
MPVFCMAKESFSYGMMVYRIVNLGMFIPAIFQINSLARAMLFLINFKKIIGRQASSKPIITINNDALLTVLRTARATEAETFQANNITIENANENNLI